MSGFYSTRLRDGYRLRAFVSTTPLQFSRNLAALLHFDGADASTTFTDETGKVWTAAGNAQLDTAQSVFGGASLLLGGSGDRITTPNHADFDFGSGDFTLEAWIRPVGVSASQCIASNWYGVNAAYCAWIWYISGGKMQLSYGVGSTNAGAATTSSLTAAVQTHVVAQRRSNVVEYFIGGVKDATTYALVGNLNVAPGPSIAIGCNSPSTGAGNFFNGHIDEVRISKGIARYTANFTPPAAPFPID